MIIGKAGKPVAKLVRYQRKVEQRRPGALKGRIKIADDFDELPDDIAEAFGMKKYSSFSQKSRSIFCTDNLKCTPIGRALFRFISHFPLSHRHGVDKRKYFGQIN